MAESDKNYEFVEYKGSQKKLLLKTSLVTESEVLCLRFDPDDNHLAVGCLDGTLKVYYLQTGNIRFNAKLNPEGNQSSPCSCIRWRPSNSHSDYNLITTGDGLGNIINWTGHTGKEVSRVNEKDNQIMCMDYDCNGEMLATAGKDNTIRIYSDTNKTAEFKILEKGYMSENAHGNRIFSLKFLPDDPNILISGSWDQNINIWDLREKNCVYSFIGGKISGDSIDYKDGKILVGANTARDQLNIFDYKTRKLIKSIEHEPGNRENGAFVFAAQFSKLDNNFAVASSGKNELKIFDSKRDYQPMAGITKFSKGLYALDQANLSQKIAVGGADGLVVIASALHN